METSAQRYVHTETDHNLNDPSLLVPLFYQMFAPVTVCDVGCGVGNFLYIFKQQGVQKVLGIDGVWANENLLAKYLDKDEFIPVDFEKEVNLSLPRFDLCICLEVAEHIHEEYANGFICLLTTLSDTVIFSAALPYQGGINHVNEQKEEYWEGKFNKHGFVKHDIIRHQIFANKKISAHYRRNIVVYSRKDLNHFKHLPFADVAIQENCQERLYKDLMAGTLSTSRFAQYFFKVLMVKLSGKGLTRIAKKLIGKKV